MSFLEINKKVLESQYAGFWEELCAGDGDDFCIEDIKIESAASGEPVISVKGLHVHSPRNPLQEAKRLVDSLGSQMSPIVIFGFGLGYTAQAAAALGAPVIVVEKYKSILLKAFELRDFSGFLSDNKIIFISGGSGDGITSALSIAHELTAGEDLHEKKKMPSILRNRALVGLDEQWYKSIEDKIRTWSMRDDVNTATHKRFGKRWVRNLTRNMSAIRDLPGISRLKDIAKIRTPDDTKTQSEDTLPVFLAAAGPSLDKIKPLLRDIYDRCIVVAVDTSLRFFVKNGVYPDFVLVVDPQFWNSRHLDRCLCDKTRQKTALVAESAVYPPVLNLPFVNKFLCGSLFPLGVYIEKQVDPKGRLGAGGSVATTAWDFARSLGAGEIWIAGLDLAFPGLKTHFHGARFEERANAESCRFSPVEKWVTRALRDGFPFKAKSADGNDVLTDRRLSLYASWFENQFSQNNNIKNYCLFQEGLSITGLQPQSVEKFLSLPRRREEIDRAVSNVFCAIENEFNSQKEKAERSKRYDEAVSVLEKGLKNIREAAEEGSEIARRALRYPLNDQKRGKTLKDLDIITRRITESDVKEVAGFLIPSIEEEKNEKDQFLAYLKSLLNFFNAIIIQLTDNNYVKI